MPPLFLALALCCPAGVIEAELRPPLADLTRFPPRAVTEDWCAFQRRHLAWLEAQAAIDPGRGALWAAWRMDLNHRAACWEELRMAHSYAESWPNDARRHLAELRDLVGRHNYFVGVMPAAVDLRRFQRTDR